MNKNLKISLSLLLFPIITFCPPKGFAFFAGGKTFSSNTSGSLKYIEKNSSEEENNSTKKTENHDPNQVPQVSSSVSIQATESTINNSKPTQPNEAMVRLGIDYDLPTTKTQNDTYNAPSLLFYNDGKKSEAIESAAQFIHRLINAGKLLDACSKSSKLESKEPTINERITKALRELHLRLNNEQKNAHASVLKLLTEQKSNFTQSTNSILSIILTLKSIGISQVISGKDVEAYNQNIQEEIDALRKESKIFENEKNAQIQHLQKIKEELNNHLEPISEKKESK